MILKQCLLTNNDCYKHNEKINGKPVGIIVHSTGSNQKRLGRYVQPASTDPNYSTIIADIGKNKYNNHWNRPNVEKCVHAFIGINSAGVVETYQTLPYDVCCWGIGRGNKGSYNYNPTAHIQFEICEDGLTDATYFEKAFQEAIEYCAYLCKELGIPASAIKSHYEGYKAGYGSGHADCDHWLKKHGKNMNWFREQVQKLLEDKPEPAIDPYDVRVTASAGVKIRKGPGTNYGTNGVLKKNTVVTIVAESTGVGAKLWGQLKDGRGWIALDYTEKAETFEPYTVKVTATAGVKLRKGPGTNYGTNGVLKYGSTVTIVDESEGKGADLWGKLEDGRGWIALDYTQKVEKEEFKPYKVKVTTSVGVNIRKGPGTNYSKTGTLKKGSIVTIVSESEGKGAKLWGELDISGWISLDYCAKV